jgi:hypothetical protein
MPHLFNPKTNPWAAELLRLASQVFPALGDGERHLVAALYAARLYDRHVSDIPPRYRPGYLGYSVLAGEYVGGRRVRIVVTLNEVRERRDFPLAINEHDHVILLHVGNGRVAELFNGPGESAPKHASDIEILLEKLRQREPEDFAEWRGDGLRPASDRELRERFPGRPTEPVNDAAEVPPGKGGGNDRRGPGGPGEPGGPGGGGSDDGNGDGSGGLTEYLNHPVMLGVDGRLYDEILEQT